MEKIKKYWKEIIIGILVIFSLNKCTVACNRDSKIKKQNTEIVQKDSLIQIQKDSLNILKIRWNDAQQSQNTYQDIALGNQHELLNQLNELTGQNNALKNQVQKLTSDNNKLKQQIKLLKSNE